MATLVVGTAGHIDHGKSALVRALTGRDPDRLPEERARGITIDLGFAHAEAGDVTLSFVDVPGHERFVPNMLAGAGGVDAVLLVIAATEGVRAQTREHLDICRLLGVSRGVIALTKCDLAEPAALGAGLAAARDLVAGTTLRDAPVVPVSSVTGLGLDDLRTALAALARDPGLSSRRAGLMRLPVDRAFTLAGFGTTVTGTLTDGTVRIGDHLTAYPDGQPVRVRGLHVHNRAVEQAVAPTRVALNLAGVECRDVPRGTTLAAPDTLTVTRRMDVRVQCLPDVRLRPGSRVRVHHGTAEATARVTVLADPVVRLSCDRPLAIVRGDRCILRALSPVATLAGGLVLDPDPPREGGRRAADPPRIARLMAAAIPLELWMEESRARGVTAEQIARRGGVTAAQARASIDDAVRRGRAAGRGPWYAATEVARLVDRARVVLEAVHRAQPAETGCPRATFAEQLVRRAAPDLVDAVIAVLGSEVTADGDQIALASHQPVATGGDAAVALVEALRAGGLTPPDTGLVAASMGATEVAALVARLVRDRRLVRLGDLVFHPDVLAEFKARVRRDTPAQGRIEMADFKARYGLTRKYAIPLLEWLDRERVTRRVGETRVVLS